MDDEEGWWMWRVGGVLLLPLHSNKILHHTSIIILSSAAVITGFFFSFFFLSSSSFVVVLCLCAWGKIANKWCTMDGKGRVTYIYAKRNGRLRIMLDFLCGCQTQFYSHTSMSSPIPLSSNHQRIFIFPIINNN